MKTLTMQTIHRLMASLLRNHCSSFQLPDGMTRFVTSVFQPATRADWKVGVTTLTAPLLRAQSTEFGWGMHAAILTLAFQLAAGGGEPVVQWAKVAGGTGGAQNMALAPDGEIYVVGSFDTWSSAMPETVLHKFDLEGTPIGRQASRGEQILGVAVDSVGNYYLTGRVWDPDRLGMGLKNDFYLAKYSSAGTLLWERTTGSPGPENKYLSQGGWDIALDVAGNIYVTGSSSGAAVFGNVTFPATPGGPLLCKYDPDGTLLWVKRVEGAGDASGVGGYAASMALDRNGNIVITGYLYNGPASFGGTVVNIAGPYSGYSFTAKYGPTGEVLWAKQTDGGRGVAVDRQGNIYWCGSGDMLGPWGTMYCGKLSAAGELVWKRIIPNAFCNGVALDGKDEPVFGGEFHGTINLDGHVVSAIPNTEQKILICKANAGGIFEWAVGDAGQTRTWYSHVVCDGSGNIYATGLVSCIYNDDLVCDPGLLGSFPLPPPTDGSVDFFVARLFDPSAVAVQLKIARTTSGLGLSWPVQATNYVLEAATTLPAISWDLVTNTPTVGPSERSVELPLTGTAKFFRLRGP